MAKRSYAHVDYTEANKPKKRKLERINASKIDKKGGFFGITGPNPVDHYKAYKHILREKSPFKIYEQTPETARLIKRRTKHIKDPRLSVTIGDVFDVVKTEPKPGRPPLFVYGHLDFCTTAKVLCRDHDLKKNLEALAQCTNLKNTFFLEMTFSIWGDKKFSTGKNMNLFILEKYIPMIFRRYGWKVTNPKGHAQKSKGWKYSRTYRDGCPMINGFYKLERRW